MFFKIAAGTIGLTLVMTLATCGQDSMLRGTNSTLINSRSMSFDNLTRTATFQGDVIVVDPALKIMSDTMTVVFDTNNAPETITALGNVRIWQVDRIAVSKKAVYSVKSGLLVLTGNPVLTRAGDRMTGKRIIFRRDEEKVTGEDVSIQFTPSQTNDIRKIFGP